MSFSGFFDLASGGHLLCVFIPSLLWLATVWTFPLGLREGHGSWSLYLTKKKRGTEKGFRGQEPHSLLLNFNNTNYLLIWTVHLMKAMLLLVQTNKNGSLHKHQSIMKNWLKIMQILKGSLHFTSLSGT